MLRTGTPLVPDASVQCPSVPDILNLLAQAEDKTPAQQPASCIGKRRSSIAPFLKWTNLSTQTNIGARATPQPLSVSIAARKDGAKVLEPPGQTARSTGLNNAHAPDPTPLPKVTPQSATHAPDPSAASGDPLDRLELDLPASVVRSNLKIMVPNPNISEFYVLPNGEEVGKFSVKYLLYLDQKSMRKRRQQHSRKSTAQRARS